MASGQQDGGVQAADAVAAGLAVVGQQAPDHIVVDAHAADQGVARRDLQHLGGAQGGDAVSGFFRQAQAEQGLLAVGADQALGQHQVGIFPRYLNCQSSPLGWSIYPRSYYRELKKLQMHWEPKR